MIGYIYIDTNEELKEVFENMKDVSCIGLAVQTTGGSPRKDKLRLIQIAIEENPTIIIDLFRIDDTGRKYIKEFLESDVIKVAHNAKFSYKFLYTEEIDITKNLYDTMLAAQVINSGYAEMKLKLEDVVLHFTNIGINKEQQKSDWTKEVLTHEQLSYTAYNAYVLLPLRKILNEKLKKYKLTLVASIEFTAIPAVAQMEINGIYVDVKKMELLQSNYIDKQDILKQELTLYFPSANINLSSPVQLKNALESIGIAVTSTSKEVLIPISQKYEVVKLILQYKKIDKLIQFTRKIINSVEEDERLYSEYFQCKTKTGRFSCADFNLQQIPHEPAIRECFTVPQGKVLVMADYSQIELRVASEIADDYRIIKSYKNNQDLHSLTASLVNDMPLEKVTKTQRQSAKALNFGLLYGMGSSKFKDYAMNNYGVEMSLVEAEKFRNRFFTYYDGIKKWHKINSIKLKGIMANQYFETRTLANRRRVWLGEPSFTEVINTPVQGTGADILKIALGMLPKELRGTSAKILATVHDEILIEADDEEAEKIKEILQNIMELAGRELLKKVPIVAEAVIASNWGEK